MSLTPEQKEAILTTAWTIVGAMNLNCQIECTEETQGEKLAVAVSIYTPENAKFLIGKSGQNLVALEHILRAMVVKEHATSVQTLTVDVNDYRKLRASHIRDVAKQAVMRVRNTQRAEALMPMTSYERRVVHMELASIPDVATESVGQEPQRRIIIKPL